MTENDIKEALSRSFVNMIAAHSGFKCVDIPSDHGTDVVIKEVVTRQKSNGRKRYYDSGAMIGCQFKATTEKKITRNKDHVIYQLENKTYNDMYHRKYSQTPLILFIYILPNDKHQWVDCQPDSLIAKRHVYWWTIPDDAIPLENEESKKSIHINNGNLLKLDTLRYIFKELLPTPILK